jgi:hopanoid biosynthesis associated radical SAM protein HpnH
MGVPWIQQYHVASHILKQKITGKKRYPLVLMLEPLFQCNLTCNGCGKILHPEEVLKQRLSLEECLSAVEECNAPVVSIAGGEPLLHEEMPQIVREIIGRKRFVYLCTNGLLLEKRLHDFQPSSFFTFSVHLDGKRERHDASVSRKGVFDLALRAIHTARDTGFRVTINCTLYEGVDAQEVAEFLDFVMSLGIEGITVSPGFHHLSVTSQEIFLKRLTSKKLFRDILALGKGKGWRFNHTPLYMDFLAGNRDYPCTPWGNPTRNVFGWQRPCYLLSDGGYASNFQELMEDTDWDHYGPGRNPKCSQCMLHSGFEATAVNDLIRHPLRALRIALSGVNTESPLAPDPLMDPLQSRYGEASENR